jgi:hypothetical protein
MLEEVVVVVSVEEEAEVVTLAVRMGVQEGLEEERQGAACWGRRRNLTWVPAWNQGGLKREVCVSLSAPATGCEPTPGLPQPIRCFVLQVARCVYAVQDDQKLEEIAAVYGTTWLDMYALNPTIKTPDRVMSVGQVINVGHLYHVVPGDYLQKIANRFGSTVEGILAMNADILPKHADDIKANQVSSARTRVPPFPTNSRNADI